MPQGITANSPRFSPDGQRLSFNYGESSGDGSLAVVGRDGQNIRAVADQWCTFFCGSAWHPTSGEIFFARVGGLNAVAASGGTSRVVYDRFGSVGSVDVSPDGQTLVFREFRPVLYTLADGTRKELATQDSAYGIRFSPDGKKLVYQDSSTNAIRIRDLETDATTTLIDTDNYLSAADWFPDGNQLAVITEEGVELFTLKAGAEPERKLLKKGFALKDVDVSPDGKAIAYCINGQRSIFVMTGF